MKSALNELFLEQDTKITGLEKYLSMVSESKPKEEDIDGEFSYTV